MTCIATNASRPHPGMKRAFAWTPWLGLLLLPLLAPAANAPMDPVVAFFTALAEADPERMKNAITDDMLLLEQGEVWNREKVLSLTQPKTSVRRNFFSPISQVVRGDTALVNYWNKALVRAANGEERTLAWLESVVAVRAGGDWKIQQMHSTRLTPEQIPSDVQFQERR